MLRLLIFVLIVIPVLEIWILVASGRIFGWLVTLLFVILTGVTGAALAKKQGLHIWRLAQIQLQQGEMPGDAILDGICIFAGGLLLLTPGFFTDAVGFSLLFSYTRNMFKIGIKKWLYKNIKDGKIRLHFGKW